MSLGYLPLLLFLLYATVQDIRSLAVERVTLLVWGGVAIFGGVWGAWPYSVVGAVGCYLLLAIAGTGRGDRVGGFIIGWLLGAPDGFTAISLALLLTAGLAWITRRSPHHLALYPFLSIGVAAIIGYQMVRVYLARIG